MKHKIIIPILSALLLVWSCTANYFSRIQGIEQEVYNNPEGALDSLKHLGKCFPKMSAREQAYFSLVYAMSLDKSYIDTTDASILAPAIDYYSKHGTPRERMLTFYYLGRIQENSGRYAESILSLTKSIEQPWEDNAYRGRAYVAMANAYIANYNIEEESRCLDSAAVYYGRTGDSTLVRITRYTKAVNLINKKELSAALAILEELLTHEDLDFHLKNYCLQQDSYALALLNETRHFPRALQQYQETISRGEALSDSHAAAYAYILYHTGHKDESESIFESLRLMGLSSKAKADSWKSRICYDEKNYNDAFLLQESALVLQDSLVRESLNQSLLATQRDYFSEKASLERKNSELLKNRIAILLLSGAFLIGILLTVLIVLRKNEAQRISRNESILEELRTELFRHGELNNESTRQIASLRSQFKAVYKRHFDLLAQFYEEYDIMRRNGVPEEKRNRQILKIIDGLRGDSQSGNTFEAIVDKDMGGIVTSLRKDFPSFARGDYRLFSYYVAGFSTKTISIIVGDLSADAIYMRKSRMKRIIETSNCPRRESYLEYL